MRVLVTGGCGFIGSHLCRRLVEEGHDVTILDDLSTGRRDNAPAEAVIITGDVADGEAVAPLVAQSDAVFHLAAIASVETCRKEPERSHRTNFEGSARIMDAAARAQVPVVYASSAAVYGDNPERPLTEIADTNPLSQYGRDKLAAEQYAAKLWKEKKLRSTGLRFFNVYGPGQDPSSPYSGVISKFAEAARNGEPVTIFGDGEQSRDFIYVGDIVALLMKAWKAAGSAESFNGCTGNEISINRLALAVGEAAGRPLQVNQAPAREGDIRHSKGSPLKAQNILGFTAQTSLADGLAQLFAAEAAHA